VQDPAVVAQALALRPAAEGDGELTLLGATLTDPAWPAGWGFTGAQERVLAACATAPPLPRGLTPGALARALRALPVEAVCVAGARGDAEGARRWLEELRHVRLEITGNDLLAAGVARGPEVGAGLARALEAKLEGRAAGRAAELRAALERP
jgi:tRNA nucleotidyltransferase (CCA-adding enzyme)